jgi:chorismate synthase
MGRLRFLTAGESHGPALAATVEGIPGGLPITAEQIAVDLARRQRGYGRGARSTSIEHDRAEILAGVRHGLTIGSPILLLIRNRDWENWTRVMQVEPLDDEQAAELAALIAAGDKRATPITALRAGHADLAGAVKYGLGDVRNILERASARETAARVAAGAVARAFLAELGIDVWSYTAEVGGVAMDRARMTRSRDEAEASPLRCPDETAEAAIIARIDEARTAGDTVGGVFEVVATGLPIGLGSHVQWDRRLDGALAGAVMSIPIVKGVEFGLGFEQTRLLGSQVMDVVEGRDAAGEWHRSTNNAGGLEGGMSNGQPLVLRGAVKPISTLPRPLRSADLVTGLPVEKGHYERSDISVVPAAGVVAEAMVCLTLADMALDKFGGDSMAETLDNAARYRARAAAGNPGAASPGPGRAQGTPAGNFAPAESE